MSDPNQPSDPNPFQPPPTIQNTPAPVGNLEAGMVIKKFREQIHALGALWIILGAVLFGLLVVAMQSGIQEPTVTGIYLALGIFYFAIGLATVFKQMWGVYTGLGISYLTLLLNIVSLNICGIVIMIVVILQAHRVIGWSRQLRSQNIPLNAKNAGS